MEILEIKILLPIVTVFIIDGEFVKEQVKAGIAELLGLSEEFEISIFDLGSFKVEIEVVKGYSKKPIIEDALLFKINIPYNFDKIFDAHLIRNPDYQIPKSIDKYYYEQTVGDLFFKEIFYLLLLVEIACPTSIKTREGDLFINNKFIKKTLSITGTRREHYMYFEELHWFNYENLKVEQVLNWFKKNKFSFFRHSTSKTERALNAFSHLFNGNPVVFNLFWSLIGIEALYCSSKEGISEQINEKTQILLGPISDFKKRLKSMYNFRSSLIHGSMDIPPELYDLEDDLEIKFTNDLINSEALAQAILLTTFQKMILLDKRELSFRYVLNQ